MKQLFFIVIACLLVNCVFSQSHDGVQLLADSLQSKHFFLQSETPTDVQPTKKEGKKFGANLYGFIRNYFFVDSRETLQSSGGLFNQIPKDVQLDDLGQDLMQKPSARLLAISSRIGLNIVGPDLLGAGTSAKIEADFCGYSGSTTLFRIRQAYLKMDWTNHAILLGQAWHPMAGDVRPDVLSTSAGSPFNPFSRAPQLRYDFQKNGFRLTAAALYQLQYTSAGPDGNTFTYANNTIFPEFFLSAEYAKNGFSVGVGADYLRLIPVKEDSILRGGKKVFAKVSGSVDGISPMIYATYITPKLNVEAKVVYAQNTSHLNMMSGYGVTAIDSLGNRQYATLNSLCAWANVFYGEKFRGGVFAGFSKNFGANKDFLSEDMLYVRGFKNIDMMYRVCPSFSYNLTHFNIGLEYEMTAVQYGKTNNRGAVASDQHSVFNHRLSLMVKYNF